LQADNTGVHAASQTYHKAPITDVNGPSHVAVRQPDIVGYAVQPAGASSSGRTANCLMPDAAEHEMIKARTESVQSIADVM
jgi:hypothetical protein